MALGMVLSTHPGCIVSVSARFEGGGQVGSPKMRNRLAATELRRFETDLGPNQLKECCGRAFGAS